MWMLVFYTGIPAFATAQDSTWIRINQLGYTPASSKVAVLVCKIGPKIPASFDLVETRNGTVVYHAPIGKDYGAYGPFNNSFRLNFSAARRPGDYFLRYGAVKSPVFHIGEDVYAGTPDFVLRYMRQQRSGFNPFLKDSCHTHDGYTMYGPMPDTTLIDVAGGWHDATDYLQYVTTSANATYHLLSAWRDFPEAFGDSHQANGLEGANGIADVLDEAKWGLNWLLKMHPRKDWIFHQLADDRDHHGFRLPSHDSVNYGLGNGLGRPVYFATGKPQGLGKYLNRSNGIANIAGKFCSAFALGASLYRRSDSSLSALLQQRALSSWQLGLTQPGVCQTAPNREPYFYEEENWTDDMELASAELYRLTGNPQYRTKSLQYSEAEKVTPWMGADTARHYQWYPFHNFGHYELGLAAYYRQGIEKVWIKAQHNAFFRGVPFIWCSNNLTVSFAIQCYCYRTMTGDARYIQLEQACFDWLFGCNPWGKAMVYGLPAHGDTPRHPHSSLSYLYGYPLDGGMVDGPVYGSIYKNLRGLKLYLPDPYAAFQSGLVVYHDDAGDYSTNEPTMDGTASLVWLLAAKQHEASRSTNYGSSRSTSHGSFRSTSQHGVSHITSHGAIVRGDMRQKKMALVFTGDEFGDGGDTIATTLQQAGVRASFFLTGNFYRNKSFGPLIRRLKRQGHYLGSHSDKHLLYCDWEKRDSLLVTRRQFDEDIRHAYAEMKKWRIAMQNAPFFLPPYEWYNDSIAAWSRSAGLRLVNFTPGTRSNADYTYPEMGSSYLGSDSIMRSILSFEQQSPTGLNGFILLLHIGTDPRRTDKAYEKLGALIRALKARSYQLVRIDQLLE